MKTAFLFVLFLLFARLPFPAISAAQKQTTDALHTPAKGDPERKAIMDALRDNYRQQNGSTVIFQVNYLKVHNGWTWADVTPLDEKGKAVAEGGPALLHNENDTWKVIDLSVIPEDPDNPQGALDPDAKFIKEVQKRWTGVPADIFPKRKK
jgi:hypothetical protein